MTRKQILFTVGGIVLVLVVCVVTYQQSAQKRVSSTTEEMGKSQSTLTRKDTMVPVPEKIDDITATITAESADDFSALDEESASVESDIDLDSESVTNLGTSYDENSF